MVVPLVPAEEVCCGVKLVLEVHEVAGGKSDEPGCVVCLLTSPNSDLLPVAPEAGVVPEELPPAVGKENVGAPPAALLIAGVVDDDCWT